MPETLGTSKSVPDSRKKRATVRSTSKLKTHKACKMLHEGNFDSDKQRRFFAARCAERKRK